MHSTSNRFITIIFFTVGLIFIGAGLLLSVNRVTQFANMLNVVISLDGAQGVARLWLVRVVLIVAGMPLLFYPARRTSRGKPLFDLSIGLVLTVMMVLMIEGVFGLINSARSSNQGIQTVKFTNTYVEPIDNIVGYRLLPGADITATQTIDNRSIIYQVRYTIDENGRRTIPLESTPERDHFALFFGDSFTFGDGLANDELLPTYVGQFAPGYMPYNFGVSGYAPQQSLAQLQHQNIPAEVSQQQGVAIFTFVCVHINRVVGNLDHMNSWGPYTPYYELNDNDQLVHLGTFATGRPVTAAIYNILGLSETIKYFHLSIPRITDDHYYLAARILAELETELQRNFDNNVDFYVLLYPGTQYCAAPLKPQLDKLGVKYLDYSDLLTDRDQTQYFIPDGHPTGLAQQTVAEQLVEDLQLREDNDTNQ